MVAVLEVRLRPEYFPQANGLLHRPKDMTDAECASLAVYLYPDKTVTVSCWRPSWRERLMLLLGKPVWLYKYGYGGHPPVAIEVQNPFDKKEA